MPPLARWHIKSGFAYLALALVINMILVLQPVLRLPATLGALRPVFLHLFIVGWLTQIIFGVAYWMFPKVSKDRPRGSERMGWSAFTLLNLGLIIRAIGEPMFALEPSSLVGGALVLSAVAQVGASWLFIANTWSRVKER